MAVLVRALLAALLCWTKLCVEGLTFSLNGEPIPNNNMARISVNDITVSTSFSNALVCRSERTKDETNEFTHGYLQANGTNPITGGDDPNIFTTVERGWDTRRDVANNHRFHYLRRRDDNPEEGFYNCHIQSDLNTPVGLYILYPITAVSVSIEVEAGTATFRVRCTSTGGRALDMTLSGPDGYSADISSRIQPDGSRSYLGSDMYTATTDVISGGRDGDVYQCNVTSSRSLTGSTTVRVVAPTITSLQQTAPTAVTVTWSTPSELSVTGYIVHYGLAGGGGDGRMDVDSGLTTTEISGLTNGQTYTISVEVTSMNTLPGVSEEMDIRLSPDPPGGVMAVAETDSVRVSWESVGDADSYTVTLSQAQGAEQDGLCSTESHSFTLSEIMATFASVPIGQDVGPSETGMLRAYTTYVVTVKTVSAVRGTSQDSQRRTVLTPQTSAGEAPGNVVAEPEGLTEISVQWSGLSTCRLVNGAIAKYRVQYRVTGWNESRQDVEADGDWREGGSVVLTELTPLTNYSISVAAVNEKGDVGVFSEPVTEQPREVPGAQQSNDGEARQSNAGAIAAGILIPIFLVAVIAILLVVAFVWWRRRSTSAKTTLDPHYELTDSSEPVHYSKGPASPKEEKITEPKITRFPETDKHAMEGERVVFRVRVTGAPKPKLTWYHDGEEVVPDYSKELAEDGFLTMPSAEIKHSGVYQLVAVNKAGSAERVVKLFVKRDGEPSPFVARKQISFSPMPVDQFGQYVARCHANDNRVFRDQYLELDKDADFPKTIGTSQELKPLNRFANITVYDNNRIVLRPIEGHADCQREFVNACYIDGYKFRNKFIATQGPLPKTLVDFWRLVWQEKPPTIVMVTNLKEGTKIKCQQYWPESGTKNFGPFEVTISEEETLADYTIRTLVVQLKGSSERPLKVTQFHFTAWPDHGVPDYATPILAFHRKIKKQHRPSKGPMLVHCSAGVGRTGTLVTIDRVLDQIAKEGTVDIAGVIQHLRSQRMKMVQNPEQYIFINDAILEAVTCGDTQIGASDLRRAIQTLSRRDPQSRVTGFDSQFKVLEQVSPRPDQVPREKALDNPTKNRTEDFLPSDRWRVLLKGDLEDYIHAVVVNGYKQQRAFIIAQSPMQPTARDFWKMVYDRKCGVIVMLCDLVEAGKEACHQYWPSSGVKEVGEFAVDMLLEEKFEGYCLRTLNVLHKKMNKNHQVQQIYINNWAPDGHCSHLHTITDAIGEVTKIQQRTGNNPIVVHCSDTVSRSGMFCAIATTIERCKTEGVVDVFQVVKALRVQKPGAVRTVAQYQTIFEAVLVYLDSFETYGNFQDI